ncbi:MAG: GNAT family N-acetyltransferase, partial [Verrucomicrobiaceae bacterium]
GQGFGKKLLLAAEAIAVSRGCTGSWLGTFDFQARDFYQHLGYRVFAELPGFPPGHTHFHLSKKLVPARAEADPTTPRIPPAGIRQATVADSAGWLRLREMLWPGADHHADIARHFGQPTAGVTLVAEDAAGKITAFAEVSVRTDWVDGATTSPVAFLEGIFVDPAARGAGIARALVSAAVEWARSNGYHELGSNTDIGNGDAIAFHLACGFREAERNAAFIRGVDP